MFETDNLFLAAPDISKPDMVSAPPKGVIRCQGKNFSLLEPSTTGSTYERS